MFELRIESKIAAATLTCLAALTATAAGQSSRSANAVSFDLTEGTWMSLDVSPDGRSIVFDLLGDIYSVPAAGGDAMLIHGGPAMQRIPSFSSDGRRLIYMSDASGTDNAWVSDAGGSGARQITHEQEDILMSAAWGPQDDSAGVIKVRSTFANRNSSEMWLYDLAGGRGRVLVETPPSGRDIEEPSFAPDGRFVYYTERLTTPWVYVDANQMNYAISRRDLTTGKSEQIVGGFGSATSAQVSPDGRRLAFIRRVREKTVLFVHDLQSGAQQPVYADLDRDLHASYSPQATYYPRFDWFPDNRDVAIWGQGKLWRVNTSTGIAQEIPFRARSTHRIEPTLRFEHELSPERFDVRIVRQIAPSPDGKQVVVAAVGHLWRKALPAGTPQRLTQATAFEFDPSYSADGRWLAYVEWDDERGSSLKIASARGGASRTIVNSAGLIREPVFSPDGKWLAYRISAGDKAIGGFRIKPGLYLVAVTGGEGRFLTQAHEAPQFSADGERIYFAANYPTADGMSRKLQSVNLDGLDLRDHARTVDTDTTELRISPDQRWISFRRYQRYYVTRYRETGTPLVLATNIDAAPVTGLSDLGGHSLAWSNDSAHVHWALGAGLYRVPVSELPAGTGWIDARPYAQLGLNLPVDVPSGALALVNARLITMRAEEVIERGTVIVRGNRIEALGPSDAIRIPADAKVVDVSGKTVMPGLVDMHGHTDCCYGIGVVPQKQSLRYAQLAFGVTTNFDPYSTEFTAYETSEATLAGVAVGPRWIPSGGVIHGRGQRPGAYYPVRNDDDARRAAEHKRALGGVFMKSYQQPQREQRQRIIRAARANGLMVAGEGELQFYTNITMMLDGYTTLEHNLPPARYYDDIVQLMSHGSIANTPTLVVLFGELFGENYLYEQNEVWKDPKVRAYVHESPHTNYSPLGTPHSAPPHVRAMNSVKVAPELWDIGFRSVSRSLQRLDAAGVIVNAGSHGQVAGLSMHWEMWLLAEGGMSNHRVLRAATLNGAKTLALDRQIGSLEAGKLADLIVLDANPLENIRNTNTVSMTMVNGRLYDSLGMNEIGNHPRSRGKFYWELPDYHGIDWNESWSGQ